MAFGQLHARPAAFGRNFRRNACRTVRFLEPAAWPQGAPRQGASACNNLRRGGLAGCKPLIGLEETMVPGRAAPLGQASLRALGYWSLRAKRGNLSSLAHARLAEIASSPTQVGLARLAHLNSPISGKPEIGGLLAMTRDSRDCELRTGRRTIRPDSGAGPGESCRHTPGPAGARSRRTARTRRSARCCGRSAPRRSACA